jgi:ATP adenylyltransferase
MERLWTPWRGAYVVSDKTKGCFLCEKAQQGQDQENLVLNRTALGYVLLNTFPYNPGHLMAAPYVHTGDLTGLDTEVGLALWSLALEAARALETEYAPEGFNIGLNLERAGGAGMVDHLHIHVVPRWVGDTNFMPVLGQTKVLPESLERTYDRLRPHFKA